MQEGQTREKSKEECQNLYWYLLQVHLRNDRMYMPLFIKKLLLTSDCDKYKDFSAVRNNLKKQLGSDGIERMMNIDSREIDLLRTEQVFYHYHQSHRSMLVSALSNKDWLFYHTFFRVKLELLRILDASVRSEYVNSMRRLYKSKNY
jgi:hypothetical protein